LKNAPFVLMSKTGQRSLGHFVKRLEPGEPDIDVEEVDGAEDCVHRSGQLVDRGEIGGVRPHDVRRGDELRLGEISVPLVVSRHDHLGSAIGKAFVTARPMPWVPPITTAFFPANLLMTARRI